MSGFFLFWINLLECKDSTCRGSDVLWRMSELHHPSHVLRPLETEAVDEEERLLDSSLQYISVDGDHPTIQS